MKKLALMGMTAGMLLSTDQAEASFTSDDNNSNFNNANYLAAKCGAKCQSVAASCSSASHGSSCSAVADRNHSTSYYYQSCNSQTNQGYGYQQYNSCNSSQRYSQQNSCNGRTSSDQSQWVTNQGQQNSCHSAPQATTGTNRYADNTNQTQPSAQNKDTNNKNSNRYADNNNNQAQPTNKQLNTQGNPSTKYQASNSCGGTHGCHGSPTTGTNNGGTYQASSCNAHQPTQGNTNSSYYYNPNQVAEASAHTAPPALNETDLTSKLNAQGKSTYNGLSKEGKALALKLANADCKGKNECKGLNSCKTDKNECAGKGGCKGQSKCSFKDKNLAVKVAAAKMAEKRNGLQNNAK